MCVLLLTLFTAAGHNHKVSAAPQTWMASAGTIALNSGITGTASNNVAPTGMDPWWSYERYYYFHVPTTMKITLDVRVTGTTPFEGVYLLDANGKRLKELWKDDWNYSRSTNTSKVTYSVNLKAGDYYLKQWDIYDSGEKVRFTTRVYAELTGKAAITKLTKTSNTSTKLTWKKISGVSGYEIYRSTDKNGVYQKIKTLSSGKTALKNTGLKRKNTYYYKIRGYKKINGKTYYTAFSSCKKIKC